MRFKKKKKKKTGVAGKPIGPINLRGRFGHSMALVGGSATPRSKSKNFNFFFFFLEDGKFQIIV
jgi:hypothetical protein